MDMESTPPGCCGWLHSDDMLSRSRLRALIATLTIAVSALVQVCINAYFGLLAKEGFAKTALSLIPLVFALWGVFALSRLSRTNVVVWLCITTCQLFCMISTTVTILVALIAFATAKTSVTSELTPTQRRAVSRSLIRALGLAEVFFVLVSFCAHVFAIALGLQVFVYASAQIRTQARRALERRAARNVPHAPAPALVAYDQGELPDYRDALGRPLPFSAPVRRYYPSVFEALDIAPPIIAYNPLGEPFAFAIPLEPFEHDPLLARAGVPRPQRRARVSSPRAQSRRVIIDVTPTETSDATATADSIAF